MASIVEILVGLGVVVMFMLFLWMRLVSKYPQLKGTLGEYSPMGLLKQEKTKEPRERRQQTWMENRTTI